MLYSPKQQRSAQYNLLGRRLLRRAISSPKQTHEQMLAAFGSLEAKSMDECKKIIDLKEEEEEELQNEEPEEEMEQKEEEQEKEEQEIESLGKPPASAAVACTPFYNAVLGVRQIVHPSGARMEVASPIQQLSKKPAAATAVVAAVLKKKSAAKVHICISHYEV